MSKPMGDIFHFEASDVEPGAVLLTITTADSKYVKKMAGVELLMFAAAFQQVTTIALTDLAAAQMRNAEDEEHKEANS